MPPIGAGSFSSGGTASRIFGDFGSQTPLLPEVMAPIGGIEGRNYMQKSTLEEYTAKRRQDEEATPREYVTEFGGALVEQGLPFLLQELPRQAWNTLGNVATGKSTVADAGRAFKQNIDEYKQMGWGGPHEGSSKVGQALRILKSETSTDVEIYREWLDDNYYVERYNERLRSADNPDDFEFGQFIADPLVFGIPGAGAAAGGMMKLAKLPVTLTKKALGIRTLPSIDNLTKPRASISARLAARVLDPLGKTTSVAGNTLQMIQDAPGKIAARVTKDPGMQKQVGRHRPSISRVIAGAALGGAVGDFEGMLLGAYLSGGGALLRGVGASAKAASRVLREGDTGQGSYFRRVAKELETENPYASAVWGLADRMGIGTGIEKMARVGTGATEAAVIWGPVNYLLAGGDPEQAAMLTTTSFAGGLMGGGVRELVRGRLPSVWKTQYFNLNAKFLNENRDSPYFDHLVRHAMQDPTQFSLLSYISATDDNKKIILNTEFEDTIRNLRDTQLDVFKQQAHALAEQDGTPISDEQSTQNAEVLIAEYARRNARSWKFDRTDNTIHLDISRPTMEFSKILGHEYLHFLRNVGILSDEKLIGRFTPLLDEVGGKRTMQAEEGVGGILTTVNAEGKLELNDEAVAFYRGYLRTLGETQESIDTIMADVEANRDNAAHIDHIADEFLAHQGETFVGGIGRGGLSKGRLIYEQRGKRLLLDRVTEALLGQFNSRFIDSLMVRAGIPIWANPGDFGGSFNYRDIYGNKQTDNGWRYLDSASGAELAKALEALPLPAQLRKAFSNRLDEYMAGRVKLSKEDLEGGRADQSYSTKNTSKNPSLQRELLGTSNQVIMDAAGNITGFRSVGAANKLSQQQAEAIHKLIDGADENNPALFPVGGLRKTETEAGTTYEGQYIQGWLLERLKDAAVLTDEQYRVLKEFSDVMEATPGTPFRIFYRKALRAGKGKVYGTFKGRYRNVVPYSIVISKPAGRGTGYNIYFRLLDLELLEKNVDRALGDISRGKRKLPAGMNPDRSAIIQALQDYMTNHQRGYRGTGEDVGRVTTGEVKRRFTLDQASFLNELLGVRTKGNIDVNALFNELEKQGLTGSGNIIRSFRFDRMGRVQKLAGLGAFSFNYGDVKINFSGESVLPGTLPPIILKEAQKLQMQDPVRNPNFQQWFDQSAAVTSGGRPELVYYGQPSELRNYIPNQTGIVDDSAAEKQGVLVFSTAPKNFSPYTQGIEGFAEYQMLAENTNQLAEQFHALAQEYPGGFDEFLKSSATLDMYNAFDSMAGQMTRVASTALDQAPQGALAIPAYLSIQNPYRTTAKGKPLNEVLLGALAKAREGGHDGVIIKNTEGLTSYAVFSSSQVRSTAGYDALSERMGRYMDRRDMSQVKGAFDDVSPPAPEMEVSVPDFYKVSYPYYRNRGGLRIDDTNIALSGESGSETARANIDSFIQSINLPDKGPVPFTRPDPEILKQLADEYEMAEHAPESKEVLKSYDALKAETLDQWNHFVTQGVTFRPWLADGQPYARSEEMFKDIRDNNHLWFFPTFPGGEAEGGFGTFTAAVESQHPLLEQVPGLVVDGVPLVYNDVFRAVHDYVGHGTEGYQYGPMGDFNAYLEHSRVYSEVAQDAFRTETAAQNAWVHFGAHLRDINGELPQRGEPGYVAPEDRPFVDQKAVIMPDTLKDYREGKLRSREVLNPEDFFVRVMSVDPGTGLRDILIFNKKNPEQAISERTAFDSTDEEAIQQYIVAAESVEQQVTERTEIIGGVKEGKIKLVREPLNARKTYAESGIPESHHRFRLRDGSAKVIWETYPTVPDSSFNAVTDFLTKEKRPFSQHVDSRLYAAPELPNVSVQDIPEAPPASVENQLAPQQLSAQVWIPAQVTQVNAQPQAMEKVVKAPYNISKIVMEQAGNSYRILDPNGLPIAENLTRIRAERKIEQIKNADPRSRKVFGRGDERLELLDSPAQVEGGYISTRGEPSVFSDIDVWGTAEPPALIPDEVRQIATPKPAWEAGFNDYASGVTGLTPTQIKNYNTDTLTDIENDIRGIHDRQSRTDPHSDPMDILRNKEAKKQGFESWEGFTEAIEQVKLLKNEYVKQLEGLLDQGVLFSDQNVPVELIEKYLTLYTQNVAKEQVTPARMPQYAGMNQLGSVRNVSKIRRLRLIHYSPVPGLSVVDPTVFPDPRAFFFADTANVVENQYRYTATIATDRIYDLTGKTDPYGLKDDRLDLFHKYLKDNNYVGYQLEGERRVVVMLEPVDVTLTSKSRRPMTVSSGTNPVVSGEADSPYLNFSDETERIRGVRVSDRINKQKIHPAGAAEVATQALAARIANNEASVADPVNKAMLNLVSTLAPEGGAEIFYEWLLNGRNRLRTSKANKSGFETVNRLIAHFNGDLTNFVGYLTTPQKSLLMPAETKAKKPGYGAYTFGAKQGDTFLRLMGTDPDNTVQIVTGISQQNMEQIAASLNETEGLALTALDIQALFHHFSEKALQQPQIPAYYA